MKKISTLIALIFFFPVLKIPAASESTPISPLPANARIVNVPVADLRSDRTLPNKKYEYDPKQETQVLQGEIVAVKEKRGKWRRVECVEQREFTHHSKWEGYPGWILASALTADLSHQKFPPAVNLSEKELRAKLLGEASKHLGSPYLWGGRSLHDPAYKKTKTGVDCSGLVNWSFRQIGWLVPRDAHEQFLEAKRLDTTELQPGDLLFLAKKEKPEKIVHVAFISGSEKLLEAPQSGGKVREISFRDRFGSDLAELKNGSEVGDRVIYFGTLFLSEKRSENNP